MVFTARAVGARVVALHSSAVGAAGAALATRWPHLFQLLQLLGRQDLLQFHPHFRLKVGHLLLLVGGQVQPLLRVRGQQVEPAAAAFVSGRTLFVGNLIGVLRLEEAG